MNPWPIFVGIVIAVDAAHDVPTQIEASGGQFVGVVMRHQFQIVGELFQLIG